MPCEMNEETTDDFLVMTSPERSQRRGRRLSEEWLSAELAQP